MFELLRCPVCNRGYTTKFWGKVATRFRDCLGWLVGNRGGYARRGKGTHGFYVERELTLRRDVRSGVFEVVKDRLLKAFKLWFSKGWLTTGDVNRVLWELREEGKLENVEGLWIVEVDRRPGFKPVKVEHSTVSVTQLPRKPLGKYYDQVEVL